MSALCLIISLKKISPHSAHPSLASPHRAAIRLPQTTSALRPSPRACSYPTQHCPTLFSLLWPSPRTRTHHGPGRAAHSALLPRPSLAARPSTAAPHSALACHGHDVHRATTPPTPPGEGRHRPRHHLLLLAKDTTIGRSVSSVSDISDVCCKCYI
jgi:hypothetical protein